MSESSAHREVSIPPDQKSADFLALVCHELRTPLQVILSQGEILQRELTDPAQQERLATIGQHGALMLRLVNDLLDWRAIEAGAFRLAPSPVNLSTLVLQTVQSCRPAAAAKGLVLECHIAPGAPGWVHLDGDRVRQVLLNLVGNAIKYTLRGSILVSLSAPLRTSEAVLRVVDTGPGIAPADQARIFLPFVRLERTASVEGAGLGLALSARLCQCLGGGLTLERDGRQGATFVARFATPPCTATVPEKIVASGPVALRGRRVLIADDNPIVRELFTHHLMKLGAQCDAVADGKQAWLAALAGDYAMLIIDVSMPGLDGFEVTRRLRAQRGPALRIVGASGHAGATERSRAMAVGMDAFLTKPVELSALTAALGLDVSAADNRSYEIALEKLTLQFRREARAQCDALADALRRRDWADLERQAHYVHNSACVVGDDELGEACVGLKQAAVACDEQAAGRDWVRCEAALTRWVGPRERRV